MQQKIVSAFNLIYLYNTGKNLSHCIEQSVGATEQEPEGQRQTTHMDVIQIVTGQLYLTKINIYS
jgi:hypothetical protein